MVKDTENETARALSAEEGADDAAAIEKAGDAATVEEAPVETAAIVEAAPADEAQEAPVAVEVSHVSMSFNMASEQLNSLKEYFIKFLRHELFFKEFIALNDVSFTVRKGDVYGIVGTNGSGKSTILKIIAGVLEPTKGTCRIHGSIAPLIELGAGFDLELTARENIYLNGALLGYSHDYIDEHFEEIVEFAELEDFLDLPMKNYSSGMVARIAFAIATIIVPDILIVDEALAVGDVFFQEKCERRISSLINEYGTTVLFVSHSIAQVERICERAIWIEKGRKIMEGSVEDVCLAYRNMEYIDYTEQNGIMVHDEDAGADPYADMTVGELALCLWRCLHEIESEDEAASEEEALAWLLETFPQTDTTPKTPDMAASRQFAALLIHEFAKSRRKDIGEFELSALGAFADKDEILEADADAMAWCVTYGLITGKTADDGSLRVRPTESVSRIGFAKMITRTFRDRLNYHEDVSPAEHFVKAGSYDWAVEHGIMQGYRSGKFGPHDSTTRAQALAVLWRSAGRPEVDPVTSLSDMPEEEHFLKPISWAMQTGLIPAAMTEGGRIRPEEPILKSELFEIFDVYCDLNGIPSVRMQLDRESANDEVVVQFQGFDKAPRTHKDEVSRALLAHAAMLVGTGR